ncbi:MAG: flagellar biosynthetic protein FliO [Planctomycetota bacterium]
MFLVIAIIVGALLVVCLDQSTADEQKTTDSKFKAGFLLAGDPNFTAGANNGFGNQELFFKTMFMVVLVAVLGVAAIYASKKLLPRITNLPGKEIHVAETVHLGPRKTIHLLRIGGQWLLIGSTNENITKLADVTDALTDVSAQEMDTVRI